MTAVDLFRRVVGLLDETGIPYMLTGSFASAYHGVPRATQDIDLVIAPTHDQLRRLVARLPAAEYYVDEQAARDALDTQAQFNVIDLTTGWKIDFICRRTRPFSRTEFERRILADLRRRRSRRAISTTRCHSERTTAQRAGARNPLTRAGTRHASVVLSLGRGYTAAGGSEEPIRTAQASPCEHHLVVREGHSETDRLPPRQVPRPRFARARNDGRREATAAAEAAGRAPCGGRSASARGPRDCADGCTASATAIFQWS